MNIFQVLTLLVISAVSANGNSDQGGTASITLRNDRSSSRCSNGNLELVCDALTASIKLHWNAYLEEHNKDQGQIADLDMQCTMGWDARSSTILGAAGIQALDYVQEVTSTALRRASSAIIQQGVQTSYLFQMVLASSHLEVFPRRQLRGLQEGEQDVMAAVVEIRDDMKTVVSAKVSQDFQELIRTKTVSPCKETADGWKVEFEWL
eukprot:CAMPEP_0119012510 /NCGR_PEP_ID=MMETSP1176-20130426/6833_1 /TAXON_ID=265551 /ORGANISM="Synedropsis recta cf, Strain CCMP1620" /LENGTH=206 /DNA_ID=CAMNT_0006965489 /DNA_START=46 /DNA_END=666 /DNA_ORIENTATION=+